jgi:hypothetical protein
MKVLSHPSAHSAKGGEEVRDTLVRIVVGGMVVSVFALLGDLLKPKSFAGLFGAAPSVALATLVLTVRQHGITYASIEGRSMILGAMAFFLYVSVVSRLMIRKKWPALPTASVALLLWLGTALGLLWVTANRTSMLSALPSAALLPYLPDSSPNIMGPVLGVYF